TRNDCKNVPESPAGRSPAVPSHAARRSVARSPPGVPARRPAISGAVSVSTIARSSEAVGGTTGARASATAEARSSAQANGSVAKRRIIRRILPRSSRSHAEMEHAASRDADDTAGGDAQQLVGREAEDGVRMPAGRPDRVPREEVFVDERGQRGRMPERRHAADGEAG